MKAISKTLTCLAVLAILGSGQILAKKKPEKPVQERFVANINPPPVGFDSTVSVGIEEFSTDAEMQELVQTFSQKGEAGLRGALDKVNKGYLKMLGGETTHVVIAQSSPQGPGRRVQIVAKAPTAFGGGVTVGSRGDPGSYEPGVSIEHGDYPYACIQLDVDAHGNGAGMVIPFAQVSFGPDGRMVVKPMKHAGSKLINVHLEK